MEPDRRRSSVRAAFAVAVVGVSAVVMACAPPTTPGGGGTTTTTTTSTTLPWSEPTGVWTYFDMTCSVPVLGTTYTFPQSASVNVEAPATVAQGSTFDMMVAPGVFQVPTAVQGFNLVNLTNFTIRFPLSPNVTLVDTVMSAGINMGPGYPSVTKVGTDLIYKVPGPLAPGALVQLPKVRLTVTASGPVGSTIVTKLTTLSNVANFGVATVTDTCRPNNTALTFWTTTIV
jgi:hypothetical protein